MFDFELIKPNRKRRAKFLTVNSFWKSQVLALKPRILTVQSSLSRSAQSAVSHIYNQQTMDDSQVADGGLYQPSSPLASKTDGPSLPEQTSSIPRSIPNNAQQPDGSSSEAQSVPSTQNEDAMKLYSNRVRYRTEYQGVKPDENVVSREESRLDAKENQAILEYVEILETHGVGTKKYAGDKVDSYIKLLSPAVNEALRCVVDYHPQINLSTELIKIPEPFGVFFFFEKELEEYCRRTLVLAEKADLSCANRSAHDDIRVVLDFVRSKLGDAVVEERKRHERGYATFDMLWLLLKPGCEIYADPYIIGEHDPYVVKAMTASRFGTSMDMWTVTIWNVRGNSAWVGACDEAYGIERFAGEKEIKTLNYFPCEYIRYMDGVTEDDIQGIREHFIRRGKKWYNLRRKPACYSFDGMGDAVPRIRYNSLVEVDPIQYVTKYNEVCSIFDKIGHRSAPSNICKCELCDTHIYKHACKPRFDGYHRVNPLTVESLTAEQYFLCSHAVEAFLFKSRDWVILQVDGFGPADFDSSLWDRLVMKEETKSLIRNLTTVYLSGNSKTVSDKASPYRDITKVNKGATTNKSATNWSADFVGDKGEGLTFLLHGPPGVGKTYTAECIAEHTRRPLMYLTCTDIGVDPTTIESNLLDWFRLAESWGAIILIDEADIYMEQRQVSDVKRNHLVAGFLRALDYFKGILFLTTNRVGTFDEAFICRIHIQINYPEFTEEQRARIWDNVFEKLERDRESTMKIPEATKDYTSESQELRALKWNGREIRNAFQVAVALAQSYNEKDSKGRIIVKRDYIKSSVMMSKEFREYLLKVHKKDLSHMAALNGHRYDGFDSKSEDKGGKTTENY